MSNTATVQKIYEAFGRGDIPAILDTFADDIEWEYGIDPNEVPWLQPRRGKENVKEFFDSLSALEFNKFEPKTLLENGGVVVALIEVDLTVKATGKRIFDEDEVHIWHFNDAGLVTRFRHAVDTRQHIMAYRG